jgi:hypothetical protein
MYIQIRSEEGEGSEKGRDAGSRMGGRKGGRSVKRKRKILKVEGG